MRTKSRRILLSLTAAAVLASAGWTGTSGYVTVPSNVGGGEGNSDNLYPLNGAPMKYQQVISASEFRNGPTRITGIALRPDAVGGAAFSETIGSVRISLSTTSRTTATLSQTFADNVGSDQVVVYDGELPLSSAFSGPAGGPMDFDIVISLQTPFSYDPTAGNLLLDVRNLSGGVTTLLDAQDAPDSTARVWSDTVDSPTARSNDPYPSVGLVIRFLTD
jgi:hypothetical protein